MHLQPWRNRKNRRAGFPLCTKPKRRKNWRWWIKPMCWKPPRLWRKSGLDMAPPQYPDVTVEYMFVDNAAMQIIQNPKQFDIILTENMFGDIISDEASVISDRWVYCLLPLLEMNGKIALFEPIHGSYPQAAGKDIANPVGSFAFCCDAAGVSQHGRRSKTAAWCGKLDLTKCICNKRYWPGEFLFHFYHSELVCDYISGRISGPVKEEKYWVEEVNDNIIEKFWNASHTKIQFRLNDC